MATKTNIIIGILILSLISSGVIYVEWSNNAKIRVDNDKATFYVPHNTMPWIWVVAGREYNKLYDGTSLMNRDLSGIKIDTTYTSDTIIIKRTTPFKRGPVIIDTYLFEGGIDNIELFPISHTVEVFNATGKFYQYEVRDLTYDGPTFKLDGKQTYQEFGKNMKVSWWEGYRLGWIYKSGSMYVKSEKIDSDYEKFEVRLFDPVAYGYNLNLFLDGVNADRKYEYYTVANITANASDCTEEVCTICVDIDDGINNLSYDLGNKNYTCGNSSVSFLYNITTLRQNKFNDSTTIKNFTSDESGFIELDNRTDIDSFIFNISSNETSENITIDVDQDNVVDLSLPGQLKLQKLLMPWFYSDDSKVSIVNLTRNTAGTKTIYMNISTSGFEQDGKVENFSFRLDGFNIDDANNFQYQEFYNTTEFVQLGLTNATTYFMWDECNENNSLWAQTDSGTGTFSGSDGDKRNFLSSTSDSCTGGGGSGCTLSGTGWAQEKTINLDIEESSRVMFKVGCSIAAGSASGDCGGGPGDQWVQSSYGTCSYSISGTSDKTIDSYSASGSSTSDTSIYEIIKTNDTLGTWDVYNDGVFERTLTLAEEDIEIKFYGSTGVSGRVDSTCDSGTYVASSATTTLSVYYLNATGVAIPWNGTAYNYSNVTLISEVMYEAPTNIERAFINATETKPTGTTVTYEISNDNGTTWFTTVLDSFTAFSTNGNNLSYRINMTSNNTSLTPVVRNVILEVVPSSVTEVLIDVGADGNNDWNYSETLNTTNSPQYFSTNGSAVRTYISNACSKNSTCYIPSTITFGTGGIIQIREYNLTHTPSSINVTPADVEEFNPINLTFNFSGGEVQLDNLKLDYKGSKNITFFTHWYNNTSFNDTQVMQVKYSKFNVSLAPNISYWEVFPKSKDSKNVTPYGQVNTTPIWNVSSLAYDDPFDVAIFVNESFNSCLEITFSNDSAMDNTTDTLINTSAQWIYSNVSILTDSFGIWNQVSLTNCSSRFYIPFFTFAAICSECVRTSSWETEVNLITE